MVLGHKLKQLLVMRFLELLFLSEYKIELGLLVIDPLVHLIHVFLFIFGLLELLLIFLILNLLFIREGFHLLAQL